MESYPSSQELVLQMGEGQRKAMFARLRELGSATGGRTSGGFHSLNKGITSLRTMPTAVHHVEQARMHAQAAQDAVSKGNAHLAKLHNQLSAKHSVLARAVQAVRSPDFHYAQQAHDSKQADHHVMMGEHVMARKSVASARAHERMGHLKEEGQKEAGVNSHQLRGAASAHRTEAGEASLSQQARARHAQAALHLETAANARDAARSGGTEKSSAEHRADAEKFKKEADLARKSRKDADFKDYQKDLERIAAHNDTAAEKSNRLADAAAKWESEGKKANLTATEHRNVAMDHYMAGREASLKNDHETAQNHYVTADRHMAVARMKDANTLGRNNLVGHVTDTANEHLRTIGASAADRISKINKPKRPTMKRNKGVKPVEPVRPVKPVPPVKPVQPVEPVKGVSPVPPVQPK